MIVGYRLQLSAISDSKSSLRNPPTYEVRSLIHSINREIPQQHSAINTTTR